MINNNIINLQHLENPDAGETEQAVYQSFLTQKEEVFQTLLQELTEKKRPYNVLEQEYQVYQSHITAMLYEDGVLLQDKVNTSDEVYLNWTKKEIISLNEYLYYAIAQNWVDVGKLKLEGKYSDSRVLKQ